MTTEEEHSGLASGYSVEEDEDGGFRWSAFGPTGTLQGHAESRSDAEVAAQTAEVVLRRPQLPDA